MFEINLFDRYICFIPRGGYCFLIVFNIRINATRGSVTISVFCLHGYMVHSDWIIR